MHRGLYGSHEKNAKPRTLTPAAQHATTFLYTQDMTSVVRKEVRTPERFRGHVLVDGGTYGGMPMEMYHKGIYIRKSQSKNRPGPGTYMT